MLSTTRQWFTLGACPRPKWTASSHSGPLLASLLSLFAIILVSLVSAQSTDSHSMPPSLGTPDLSSMLSLKNLGEYNQLIDCVAKIKVSFTTCNQEAQQKGEAVLRYVDEKSEMGTLLKCCGIWLVRDCWVKAARGECTAEQVAQLQNMPSKMMPGLEGLCQKYPAGSPSCYTPHLIVGAILLGTLILLILLLVIIILVGRYIYRRRQVSTKLESGLADGGHRDGQRAEKVKLTSNNGETNSSVNNNNLEYIDSEKAN